MARSNRLLRQTPQASKAILFTITDTARQTTRHNWLLWPTPQLSGTSLFSLLPCVRVAVGTVTARYVLHFDATKRRNNDCGLRVADT